MEQKKYNKPTSTKANSVLLCLTCQTRINIFDMLVLTCLPWHGRSEMKSAELRTGIHSVALQQCSDLTKTNQFSFSNSPCCIRDYANVVSLWTYPTIPTHGLLETRGLLNSPACDFAGIGTGTQEVSTRLMSLSFCSVAVGLRAACCARPKPASWGSDESFGPGLTDRTKCFKLSSRYKKREPKGRLHHVR